MGFVPPTLPACDMTEEFYSSTADDLYDEPIPEPELSPWLRSVAWAILVVMGLAFVVVAAMG